MSMRFRVPDGTPTAVGRRGCQDQAPATVAWLVERVACRLLGSRLELQSGDVPYGEPLLEVRFDGDASV